MSITLPLAMMALAAFQQTDTDTTVSVNATARLEINQLAGTIVVRTWDRDVMRVQADHGSRDRIEIESRGDVVTIRARRRRGIPTYVDYQITVPASMSVKLGGVEMEIDVDGVNGDVTVHSIEGDITVRNAGGHVDVNGVEGDLIVAGARGGASVHGVDGDIQVTDVVGDLTVETIDGEVTLEGIEATNVDVSTVDGEIFYTGVIRDGGQYRLTSHDGSVVLAVVGAINATVSVATFDGDFEAASDFQVQLTEVRPGKRFSFVLGTGSAEIELESFDGSIRLIRP
jgi:DUF4097 and DUF4098 domain-containing protein YvlB